MDDEQWLPSLQASGAVRDEAVAELHGLLRRAAHRELRRRAGAVGLGAADLDDLAEQAADDATLAVLTKLGTFRGDSRFTTWAYAFAVLEVSAVIGRHRRTLGDVRLDAEQWQTLPDRWGATPADTVHAHELVGLLRQAVDTLLTSRQRRIFVAIVVDGVPLDVLTAELGVSRDVVYKSVYEARRRIREHFTASGYLAAGRDAADSVDAVEVVR
ncbi:MAG: sigma-70 family RNA polymerase sigma factor [Jatrophihabitans sp.]|uniref:sigma-70 family RNA polymerase sigma factor n=1 Tax=Jatrophihabitans sp. TaxID=1932789 RepID=UPI003F80FBDA